MAGSFYRLRRPAVRVFDTIRCCSVIKILAVGFTFWCTYVTIGYVDTWASTSTLWNRMEQVNDTFAQKITQTPPENPMYAGGIAVLVAFVLFMYWGSLHEKDDTEDEKKDKKKKQIPNWLSGTNKYHAKRKKKGKDKRSGVYSVSDAMSKHLLADKGKEQTTCAECEQCRLHEYNMQNRRTSSNLNGEHLSCKTTQTSNKTERSPSCNRIARPLCNIQGEALNGAPSRKRAHSSPEIIVTTPSPKNGACTCPRPKQNGDNALHSSARRSSAHLDRDDKITLVKFCERDCERTSEFTAKDSLHFEGETRNNLADSDKICLKCKVPCSTPAVKTNGKVLRQLDDASICLESHPHVAIAILAESVI